MSDIDRTTSPGDDELVPHKWVRILADSCADGVWARSGASACADELPVDRQLVDRIRRWQSWYDRDEDDWGLFRGDVAAFAEEGLAVARAVKAALPDWTVIYFDEACCRGVDDDMPRTAYEYEI